MTRIKLGEIIGSVKTISDKISEEAKDKVKFILPLTLSFSVLFNILYPDIIRLLTIIVLLPFFYITEKK